MLFGFGNSQAQRPDQLAIRPPTLSRLLSSFKYYSGIKLGRTPTIPVVAMVAAAHTARPTKMQRVAFDKLSSPSSSAHIDAQVTKCPAISTGFCVLRPLLQQFIVTGSPFSSDKTDSWCSIVIKASAVLDIAAMSSSVANDYIDPSSCKRLHGMILNHLGFTMSTFGMSSYESITSNNTAKNEAAVLLLQCLHKLYIVLATLTPLVEQEEFQESFSLVRQIVLGAAMEQQHKKTDDDDEENDHDSSGNHESEGFQSPIRPSQSQRLWMACWKVLDWMLLSDKSFDPKQLDNFEFTIEKLVMNLLHWMGMESTTLQEREYAIVLLQKLSHTPSLGSKALLKASIALFVVAGQPVEMLSLNDGGEGDDYAPFEILISQRREKIFYWKCLALCTNSFNPMLIQNHNNSNSNSSNNKSVVQELHEMTLLVDGTRNSCPVAEKESIVGAVECLCIFTQKMNKERHSTEMVQVLLQVVMGGSNEMCQLALPGLVVLLQHDCGMKFFLGTNAAIQFFLSLKSISSLDEPNNLECSNKSTLTNVARIVTRTISYAVLHSMTGKEYIELWQALLSNLMGMLLSQEAGVVRLAIKGVCLICKTSSPLRRFALTTYPALVSLLAQVVLYDFTSHRVRRQIMSIYWNILKGPNNPQVAEFAREPKVIEAVVQIAALQTTSSSWEESRKLALGVILKLSTNVCNHRILATQIGLLPALIRYARSYPGDPNNSAENGGLVGGDDEFEGLFGREELKRKILVLAQAL
jgi:hypothetical protein